MRYDSLPSHETPSQRPFYKSVAAGRSAVVQFFISQGASEKHCGKGAIAPAARHGHIEVASILLDAAFLLRSKGLSYHHESRGPKQSRCNLDAGDYLNS